jgi:hypothetical protein
VLRGDRREAQAVLERAARSFDEQDMAFHAVVARRGIGELTGQPAAVERVDAWLRAMGVPEPARLCRIFLPVSAG